MGHILAHIIAIPVNKLRQWYALWLSHLAGLEADGNKDIQAQWLRVIQSILIPVFITYIQALRSQPQRGCSEMNNHR